MERAVANPTIMTQFMASEIAFAAIQRAQELLGDDVVTEEMMNEFEVLMEELEVSDTNVLDALSCLENLDKPDEGAPPAAAVASAAVARIQVENEGDTSPVSVQLPYTLSNTPCTTT